MKTLTERIRERFEVRQERLKENPHSRHDAEAMQVLAEAGRYAAKADKFRERKENNTRPADLLSDSRRTAIDSIKGATPAMIAKRLGLTKEYVADYLT